jgi:pimeloyl-ACP methyl ester carboxylesterase
MRRIDKIKKQLFGVAFIISFSIFLLLNGCGGSSVDSTSSTEVKFTKTKCFLDRNESIFECGYIEVPDDYTNQKSRYTLAVMIKKAKDNSRHLPPIINIDGGPGDSSITHTYKLDFLDYDDRDVIYFSQRGTGLSKPFLECKEIFANYDELINKKFKELNISRYTDDLPQELYEKHFSQLLNQKYVKCAQKLQKEGVDPTTISTRNSAYDIESIRKALKLDKISLFGVSYGTRLALEYMELFADHIDSVVLDSVLADDVDRYAINISMRKRALKEFFELCSSDESCFEAFAQLEEHFLALVSHYNLHPYTYIYDEEHNKSIELNGGFIAFSIDSLFYFPVIESLPIMIEGMYQETLSGDTTYLQSIAKSKEYLVDNDIYFSNLMSEITLIQSYPLYLESMQEAYKALDNYSGIYQHFFLYELYVQSQVFDGKKESVYNHYNNTITTLIINGTIDHATPIEFARDIDSRLSNSQMIEFKKYGHSLITTPCGYKTINEFFKDPKNFIAPQCSTVAIKYNFVVP